MANAPGIYNITANDTLIITGLYNGNVVQQNFTTLSDKSTVHMEFESDLLNMTVGKNGNGIVAANKKGGMCTMDLRPLMANADHVFLNAQLAQWIANPTAFVLLTGSFVKNFGDGLGNQLRMSYVLSGGAVKRHVQLTENVEGETDQAIAMFKLGWLSAVPVID